MIVVQPSGGNHAMREERLAIIRRTSQYKRQVEASRSVKYPVRASHEVPRRFMRDPVSQRTKHLPLGDGMIQSRKGPSQSLVDWIINHRLSANQA